MPLTRCWVRSVPHPPSSSSTSHLGTSHHHQARDGVTRERRGARRSSTRPCGELPMAGRPCSSTTATTPTAATASPTPTAQDDAPSMVPAAALSRPGAHSIHAAKVLDKMWSRHSCTSKVLLSPAKTLELCAEEVPKLVMPLRIPVEASVRMLSRYTNFHPTHSVAKGKCSPYMQFAMLRSGGQIRPIPWPSFCVDHMEKSLSVELAISKIEVQALGGCQMNIQFRVSWSQPDWTWSFG